MAFSPPEYCRLFAQKKAYQGGVTGTPGPSPSYASDSDPDHNINMGILCPGHTNTFSFENA